MITYSCTVEDGKFLAVIEDGGKRIDTKEAPSKFAAMTLRDQARVARVAKFDHIDKPPPVTAPVRHTRPMPDDPGVAAEAARKAARERRDAERKPPAETEEARKKREAAEKQTTDFSRKTFGPQS